MEYLELSDGAYNIWLFQALEKDAGEGRSTQISALTLPAHRSQL